MLYLPREQVTPGLQHNLKYKNQMECYTYWGSRWHQACSIIWSIRSSGCRDPCCCSCLFLFLSLFHLLHFWKQFGMFSIFWVPYFHLTYPGTYGLWLDYDISKTDWSSWPPWAEPWRSKSFTGVTLFNSKHLINLFFLCHDFYGDDFKVKKLFCLNYAEMCIY